MDVFDFGLMAVFGFDLMAFVPGCKLERPDLVESRRFVVSVGMKEWVGLLSKARAGETGCGLESSPAERVARIRNCSCSGRSGSLMRLMSFVCGSLVLAEAMMVVVAMGCISAPS